ncbi:MAG TPA: ATP-binding protein [bacterium]|nr:PAS domain S-box protein [Chlamydiota bacterium]HOE27254.1 ATP-binding protein [bacterium]
MKLARERTELLSRVKWFMLLRLILISVLMPVSAWVFGQGATPFFFVIGVLYCATLLYIVLLKTPVRLRTQAYGQFLFDAAVVTALLSFTGGINSNFVLLYVLVIVFASLILGRQAGMVLAVSSSGFYAVLALLECCSLLPPALDPARGLTCDPVYAAYLVLVRATIFCILGYFADYLVNSLYANRIEIEDLKKLNERILTQINGGLITTDASGRIIFANEGAEEVLGYTRAEMIGKSWHAFLGRTVGDFDDRWLVEEARSFARCEIWVARKNGTEIPVGFTVSSLVDGDGTPLGLLILFRDLTQMRQLEERMRRADRLSAAGAILAGVAHEVRTPLTAIRGAVEVLKESGFGDGEGAAMAEIIIKESDRLNRIISDFLVSGGPGRDSRAVEDLGAIVDEVIRVERQTRQGGEGLRVVRDRAEKSVRARVDSAQMKQVFINLIDNALDAASPRGEVTVGVERVPARPGETPAARVRVENTGPGMNAEGMARLFEPFYSTKRSGTGMGLFIAERIVRGHGGRLDAESREGRTVFTVTLPCEEDAGAGARGSAGPPPAAPPNSGG